MSGAVLTILSTIVGGGIVGLPNCLYQLGAVAFTIIMFLAMCQTINSSWIYMKAKDLTPGKPESLYELGYILFGRQSIFMISAILVFNAFGMCMIYFNLFASTAESLINYDNILEEGFFTTLNYCKIGIALAVLPVCLKREL